MGRGSYESCSKYHHLPVVQCTVFQEITSEILFVTIYLAQIAVIIMFFFLLQ